LEIFREGALGRLSKSSTARLLELTVGDSIG
jgi:hypothetical protein